MCTIIKIVCLSQRLYQKQTTFRFKSHSSCLQRLDIYCLQLSNGTMNAFFLTQKKKPITFVWNKAHLELFYNCSAIADPEAFMYFCKLSYSPFQILASMIIGQHFFSFFLIYLFRIIIYILFPHSSYYIF